MYVNASDLLARVMIAAKDANGRISWVTLDPVYHSTLVRTAIAAAKANGPNCLIASVKEALFIFLLDILNGKPQKGFFTKLEMERDNRRGSTREHTHPTRPARKGSQISNHGINKGNASPPPPSPPPPPPPPRTHMPSSEPPNGLQLAAAKDSTKDSMMKPPPKVPPITVPPQAHPYLPTSPTHDTNREDPEELLVQLELLGISLEEYEALLITEPNSPKQDLSNRKKAGNTVPVPVPAPTHPKTRQASKGRLKK